MSRQWKLIAACAAVGFLIAAFFFVFVGVLGAVEGTFYTAMVIFCPPSLLAIPFSEVMRDKGGFYAGCLLIGFLNSGLYAAIGAAIAGQLWKSD
jgi:hypothetical protein